MHKIVVSLNNQEQIEVTDENEIQQIKGIVGDWRGFIKLAGKMVRKEAISCFSEYVDPPQPKIQIGSLPNTKWIPNKKV